MKIIYAFAFAPKPKKYKCLKAVNKVAFIEGRIYKGKFQDPDKNEFKEDFNKDLKKLLDKHGYCNYKIINTKEFFRIDFENGIFGVSQRGKKAFTMDGPFRIDSGLDLYDEDYLDVFAMVSKDYYENDMIYKDVLKNNPMIKIEECKYLGIDTVKIKFSKKNEFTV